jgi:hypothetical protein
LAIGVVIISSGSGFDTPEPFGREPFGCELKAERLRVERLRIEQPRAERLVAGQPRYQFG